MVLNPKMYCVCLNHGYLNSVKQSVRSISSGGTLLSKSHYDALGLTPKATQSEVKSAYYKLSMQHHPDKNEGSEAASQQFRDISAAYEVLGNVKLRKLYDKGKPVQQLWCKEKCLTMIYCICLFSEVVDFWHGH